MAEPLPETVPNDAQPDMRVLMLAPNFQARMIEGVGVEILHHGNGLTPPSFRIARGAAADRLVAELKALAEGEADPERIEELIESFGGPGSDPTVFH